MRALVLPVVLLAACATASPTLRPHEVAAGTAARRAWREKGLPEPDAGNRCAVDRYQVHVAVTAEDYARFCPTSSPTKSFGCLAWGTTDHWFAYRRYPIVVVSPMHHTEPTIVVHELMHAYITCAELRTDPWDPGDREHSDPRVWSAPGGDSAVQTRADALTKEML